MFFSFYNTNKIIKMKRKESWLKDEAIASYPWFYCYWIPHAVKRRPPANNRK